MYDLYVYILHNLWLWMNHERTFASPEIFTFLFRFELDTIWFSFFFIQNIIHGSWLCSRANGLHTSVRADTSLHWPDHVSFHLFQFQRWWIAQTKRCGCYVHISFLWYTHYEVMSICVRSFWSYAAVCWIYGRTKFIAITYPSIGIVTVPLQLPHKMYICASVAVYTTAIS